MFIDALTDDVNYQSHISRAKFEEICHDLLERAAAPIEKALKLANVTLDELDAVEMIGGAMRVPKVQEAVSDALGGLELGMHLNSDESMALGASFHGANVSTSFKVRHVGMVDVNTFPVNVDLTDLTVGKEKKKTGGGLFGIGKKKAEEAAEEGWAKHATIFKLGSKLGVKKTIAFTHDEDVHVEVSYDESDTLPLGTGLSIEQYDVSGIADFAKEMKEKDPDLKPKVSLQFELDGSGLTRLVKAEAVVEETVMVMEEVEVDDDEEEEEAASDDKKEDEEAKSDEPAAEEKQDESEEKKEEAESAEKEGEEKTGDTKEDGAEKKEEPKKKKKKTIQVEKVSYRSRERNTIKSTEFHSAHQEKKKKHTRTLKVAKYHVGPIQPYSAEIMAESQAKLDTLAEADKARLLLEEAKNKVESYIYHIRNKLIDDEEEIGKVTSEEQREALRQSTEDAEEWMWDAEDDLKTWEDKYTELSEPAEKAFFRMAELAARPKAIEALTTKLGKIEDLMKKWETSMEHITEEERQEVLDKVQDVRAWIEEKVKAQEEADPTGDAVFTSEEVPGQTKKIEGIVARLMKKPKPKPEKKNETSAEKVSFSS